MNTTSDTILDALRIPVRPIHAERISMIEQEDFSPIVQRVTKETGITDAAYLAEGVRQLKRYYAVCAVDPLNPHGVSAQADPFWHAHILHSRLYTSFCERIYGGYLHHEPLDTSKQQDVAAATAAYEYTREVTAEVFGDADAAWWPDSRVHPEAVICTHYQVADPGLKDAAVYAHRSELLFASAE